MAAQLYSDIVELKASYTSTPVFRTDTLIVASAQAGATHFYIDHDKCPRIAEQANLKVLDLDEDPNPALWNQTAE